jgi:hypothetical protein
MKIFKKLDDVAFNTRVHVILYISAVVEGTYSIAKFIYRRLKCS